MTDHAHFVPFTNYIYPAAEVKTSQCLSVWHQTMFTLQGGRIAEIFKIGILQIHLENLPPALVFDQISPIECFKEKEWAGFGCDKHKTLLRAELEELHCPLLATLVYFEVTSPFTNLVFSQMDIQNISLRYLK